MKRGEPSTKLFEQALRELTQFLQRTPATARQVAETFRCTFGTASKRLKALRRRGDVQVGRVREGSCGSKSRLYSIKSREERRA